MEGVGVDVDNFPNFILAKTLGRDLAKVFHILQAIGAEIEKFEDMYSTFTIKEFPQGTYYGFLKGNKLNLSYEPKAIKEIELKFNLD